MKVLIFTIVIVVLASCSQERRANNEFVDKLVLDSLNINVLKYDSSYKYIFPEAMEIADLTREEITECELLLKAYIANYNVQAKKRFEEISKNHPGLKFSLDNFTIELKNYGRQYVAAINNDGEKVVYVNCFCHPSEFDYRDKELVQVEDGGNCFFNFKVDIKRKRIFDFRENGAA